MIYQRIREVRKKLGLTQNDFGSKIGLAPNTITNYENGKREPSNQAILSICREYNVNEDWLRNGTGEMFNSQTRAERAAFIVGSLLGTEDKFIQDVLIALGEMTPDEWKVIKKFVEKIKG